jgi:cell division protein FtsB
MLVVLIVVPIVIYGIYVFGSHIKSYNTLKQQRIIAQDKLAKAKHENEQLQQAVEYTKTDDFIAQKARELLGFVKPGEVKFVDKTN